MTFCIGGTMKPLLSKQSGMCRGERSARPPCRAGGIWQNVKRRRWDCPRLHQNTIWWISWHSQAIRKIRIAAGSARILSCRKVPSSVSFPTDIFCFLKYTLWKLPICWHPSPSSEWNLHFLHFLLQRFDFRGRNNIVWEMKLYCLTSQTQVFRGRNNIVWALKCKDSEIQLYSFLKSKAFSSVFVCIHLQLRAGLTDFRKVRVSWKWCIWEIKKANTMFEFQNDRSPFLKIIVATGNTRLRQRLRSWWKKEFQSTKFSSTGKSLTQIGH